MKPRIRFAIFAASAAIVVAVPERPALALQPLDEFTRAARIANLDRREAGLVAEQREHEARTAFGRLLPSLGASASYTRNQVEVSVSRPNGKGELESAIISPLDQVDASLTLRVPLVDVGAYRRLGAARDAEDAARLRIAATESDVDAEIARSYYTIVGATWLREATEKALAAARKNLEVVEARRQAERAVETDVLRARAEVERSLRSLADAERQILAARRALTTSTGLVPTPGAPAFAPPESPLPSPAEREASAIAAPLVRAAEVDAVAAEKTRGAAWAAFYPTLGATATERFTNATGFSGRYALFNAQLTLSWSLDYTTLTQARAAESAASLARTRAERVRRAQVDQVADAAERVGAETVRVGAAVAEERAADAVVSALRERLAAGTATMNEVVQAERDALTATASRIQAGADLAYARALLEAKTRRAEP